MHAEFVYLRMFTLVGADNVAITTRKKPVNAHQSIINADSAIYRSRGHEVKEKARGHVCSFEKQADNQFV